MLNKEEIEDNAVKISVPLITDDELRNIDNNFESIVEEFTKSYVKEKELVIAQYIMQKQQDKIDKLEQSNQKLIEKLEDDIENNYTIKNYTGNSYCIVGCEEIEVKEYAQEILSLLKGEKEWEK